MKKITGYLAGPINGMSDADAKDWRNDIVATMGDRFAWLDPMRRDYRGIEAQSIDEITRGDIEDIDRSDFLLVLSPKPSVGTDQEMVYAHQRGKLIITVCDNPKPSPWLRRHSTFIVRTIDEAKIFISRISEGVWGKLA